LPWCPGSFLGGAFDVTTLEGSVAEEVFPARLPRNSSSTFACTSTFLGGASDDDEDVVLVLVFMVAVFAVFAADPVLASGAIEDGSSTFKSSSGAFVLVLLAVLVDVTVVVLLG
jgi:hypothetical protein